MLSKALEINLAQSRIDVTVSDKYLILLEVMSKYQGTMEGLTVFLKELCHPYKNWQFIIKEARGYALDYFHLLKTHPSGPEAAKRYVEIFLEAVDSLQDDALKTDAVDNLLLYMQKIIRDSDNDLPRFFPTLDVAFNRIGSYKNETFFLFVRSFYQLNKLARYLSESTPEGDAANFDTLNALLVKNQQASYAYWLDEKDPQSWFGAEAGLTNIETKSLTNIFSPISHKRLKHYKEKMEAVVQSSNFHSKDLLEQLISLPGYNQLVDIYRDIPRRLFKAGEPSGQGNHWKLVFLFRIMNTAGLSSIHEETLRTINRTLTWIIEHAEAEDIEQLLRKTFAILKESAQKYPGTALNCVLNMGKATYRTDESDLVDFFNEAVVDLGFQAPELQGVGDDWQIRANTAHIQNIRTWLELIELNPKWSKTLLSSLIIHLSLCGVFIKDTDLFGRDISQFLNSDIGPVYNLAKQLTRLFPAYFNEIGAEGRLRDISTKMDEMCYRKDILVHFVRKQSHVESSNQITGLVEAVLSFWKTKDKDGLAPFIPPHIYSQIESTGPFVDGVHRYINHLLKTNHVTRTNDLLKVKTLKGKGGAIEGVSEVDRERVQLAVAFYKLLYQKYHLGFVELGEYLKQLPSSTFPNLDKLKKMILLSDTRQKLQRLLGYLERLKEVILSPKYYEAREDIYRKRHFAVDIPSMYGSYQERKFDHLGLTFRLEALVNTLFEELVDKIDLELITRATFSQIYDYLRLFYRALKLDGITSAAMERQLDLLSHSLEVRWFSFTQFLDIFRGFSEAVKNIVNDYYNNMHQQNMFKIMKQQPQSSLLSKYMPPEGTIDEEKLMHRVSEVFLRERISTSLGLQQLDVFLSRIMNTLFQQADKLPRERLRILLNYDPQKAATPIHPVNRNVFDIIYLGNKGLNLVKLIENGFPVPPGFIVTTEVFRCQDIINGYPPADKNLKEQLSREISKLERLTKKSFAAPKNPLLLSVRSGAPISQPGMMDTFLNVGINEDIVNG
ncbi:MAG: pyruvate, phosphate dikinase, partial [Deltaproteobacteria bacterium]|nr:pyruvate, phosphate dikinase [Deltaproteobacteria bacterium]